MENSDVNLTTFFKKNIFSFKQGKKSSLILHVQYMTYNISLASYIVEVYKSFILFT